MNRNDDMERRAAMDRERNAMDADMDRDDDHDGDDSHATTGGAAGVGAVTGGVIGAVGGPAGIAAGAVAGAAIGAVVERVMHGAAGEEHFEGDHDHTGDDDGHDHSFHTSDTGMAPTHGMTGSTTPGMAGTTSAGRMDTGHTETTRVPVREEELVAGTRTVPAGEVEVRKEVHTEQQHLRVPVEREEVHVERHPVNRPSDTPVGQDSQTVRVPLMREEVEVTKRPVVREEVEISRERIREQVPVNETVRREEVHVENESWDQAMPRFRQGWESRYGSTGGRWEDSEPGYRYGWEMYNDPRFRGRDWASAENELGMTWGNWAQRNGYQPSAWDRVKESVRETWENMRSPAHSRR